MKLPTFVAFNSTQQPSVTFSQMLRFISMTGKFSNTSFLRNSSRYLQCKQQPLSQLKTVSLYLKRLEDRLDICDPHIFDVAMGPDRRAMQEKLLSHFYCTPTDHCPASDSNANKTRPCPNAREKCLTRGRRCILLQLYTADQCAGSSSTLVKSQWRSLANRETSTLRDQQKQLRLRKLFKFYRIGLRARYFACLGVQQVKIRPLLSPKCRSLNVFCRGMRKLEQTKNRPFFLLGISPKRRNLFSGFQAHVNWLFARFQKHVTTVFMCKLTKNHHCGRKYFVPACFPWSTK